MVSFLEMRIIRRYSRRFKILALSPTRSPMSTHPQVVSVSGQLAIDDNLNSRVSGLLLLISGELRFESDTPTGPSTQFIPDPEDFRIEDDSKTMSFTSCGSYFSFETEECHGLLKYEMIKHCIHRVSTNTETLVLLAERMETFLKAELEENQTVETLKHALIKVMRGKPVQNTSTGSSSTVTKPRIMKRKAKEEMLEIEAKQVKN